MSSVAEKAIKAIRQYPEIFSALEEFERTKKVPKFNYRKRADITINENLLAKFKTLCSNRGISMSRMIEKYIKKEVALENTTD